jgi:hypothetical protein
LWYLSGAVVPPPAVVRWQFQWNVVEWLAVAKTRLGDGTLPPPIPPPKV